MHRLRPQSADRQARSATAEEELGALCRIHAPRLLRFLLSRGARPDDVHDLLQQVFAVFWEKRHAVRPDKVEPFLTGIAHRTLLAYKRSYRVRQALEDNHLADILRTVHAGVLSPPDHPLLRLESHRALAACIGQLPARMGQVIRMVYLEGHTRAEAARLLRITRQTLNVAEKRALTHLGNLLRRADDPASS